MARWVRTDDGPVYRITKSEADFLSAKFGMLLRADVRLQGTNRARLQQLVDQMGTAPEPWNPRRTSSRSDSGPVRITAPDGTVTTVPALNAADLRKAAPERLTISDELRGRVLKRDMQTCRYCLTTLGPFELDHVIPVAQGGATRLWNLVTACRECNQRKGNQVWRPVRLALVRGRARTTAATL
jgi:hypothetical protein